jgi:uncharacterized protein
MYYNCHIHTFHGIKDVPERFLPWPMMWLLKGNASCNVLAKILHYINPFSKKDEFDRYKNFVETGKLTNQEEIFRDVRSQYPDDTVFVVHPMDMQYMGAGQVPRDYEEQLIELKRLKDAYPRNIIPFCAIDCRRKNYLELFKQAVEKWGFKGLKLYPPLGSFPFDARYYPVYEYCQQNNLPVMAHCTDGNPVHFKGKYKDLVDLLKPTKIRIDWSLKQKDLCSYFTHPANYKKILADFPSLRICLAHFGREDEFDQVRLSMLQQFDNLYVDISYSMSDEERWPALKIALFSNPKLREHCLFGSDFYMVEIECNEREFNNKFRAYLGEDIWNQIAVINPKKWLGIA